MSAILPKKFVENLTEILKADYPVFENTLLATQAPTSIRYHREKRVTPPHPTLRPVAWAATQAEYLTERPIFTLDPAFHAGAYYVQEASSMLISEAILQHLDPKKGIKILDLCAAPGGKTTLLASIFGNNSLIVANEVIRPRVEILKENLQKWGYCNIVITNHDAEDFLPLGEFFDLILIDAPCSGEGLFRKDPKAINEWSEENVATCSARQKRIVGNAVQLLQPNGIMLYSTCTYNHSENSDNAEYFAHSFDLTPLSLNLPAEWGITPKKIGYQCFPHRSEGEGFYLAIFQKEKGGKQKSEKADNKPTFKQYQALPKKQVPIIEQWLRPEHGLTFWQKMNGEILGLPTEHLNDMVQIDRYLQRKTCGIEMGEIKGNDFVPSHSLALSVGLLNDKTPVLALNRQNALLFLKKEAFEIPENTSQGWVLVTYEGLGIGWAKVLKNRINNYLPKHFRIRMEIE